MKKHGVALLILTMVALTGLASAQRMITAQVPFDFVANGKTMPAGECKIEVQGNGQTALWISSGGQHTFALPQDSVLSKASGQTSLVFHRYGDRYFLAAIQREGRAEGYVIPMGKVESELRAQNVTERDMTLIASAE